MDVITLKKIGFVEKEIERTFNNEGATRKEIILAIPFLNGEFTWSEQFGFRQETYINKASNSLGIDINSIPELLLLLQIFKVKFNFS